MKGGKTFNKVLIILSLLSIFMIAGGVVAWSLNDPCPLRLKQGCFKLETAATPESRAKGLGGRDQLPPGNGMLFIHPSPGKHCFWMKDMRFAVDMIWLDANKKIVMIKPNAQPDTYPQSFCPDQDSLYVIELPAGAAEQNQLTVGNTLML